MPVVQHTVRELSRAIASLNLEVGRPDSKDNMDRSAIRSALIRAHEDFCAAVLALPEPHLTRAPAGKWTPAQHLEHILRAVRPVALALLVPKWFLRWRFGSPNRTPRDYDELVARYTAKLAAGGRASGRFVPPPIAAHRVGPMAADLRAAVDTLCRRMRGWSERDLDRTLLPHPLLGKVTVREMIYFTIHHAQHHQHLVERGIR